MTWHYRSYNKRFKRDLAAWIILVLLGLLLFSLMVVCITSVPADAQTLCVEAPLQPTPDEALRLHTEQLFRKLGFRTSCSVFDMAVTFYYLGGVTDTRVTDFYALYSGGDGYAVGSVLTERRAVWFGNWTMTIRKRGDVTTLARLHAGSLRGAVNKAAKVLKHQT